MTVNAANDRVVGIHWVGAEVAEILQASQAAFSHNCCRPGLPLWPEAPVMTPNSIDLSFLFYSQHEFFGVSCLICCVVKWLRLCRQVRLLCMLLPKYRLAFCLSTQLEDECDGNKRCC